MLVSRVTMLTFGLCRGRQLAEASAGGGPQELGIFHLLHLWEEGRKEHGDLILGREVAR